MDVIKKHAKLIGAFLLGVLGNAAYDLIEGAVPFPQTADDWKRWALTTLLASLGAYLPRNKQSAPQVETAVHKDLTQEDTVRVVDTALATLPEAVQRNITAYRKR